MTHPPVSTLRGRDLWLFALGLVLVAGVYLLTASRVSMDDANNDVSGAAFTAWRLADSGQPWVDDEASRPLTDLPARVGLSTNPDNGRAVIPRSPGVSAAAVPASWVLQRLGADDFGPVPQVVTAVTLTTAAVGFLYLALRRGLDQRTSLLVTAAFALATPVWSVNANALWTHVVTVLGIAGMSWAASSERWWLVGLFGGVALWGRLHAALIVAVVGLGIAIVRRRPSIAFQVGAISLGAMALASVWSWWHYGSWVPSGGYGGSSATRVLDGSADIGAGGILENQVGMWLAPACGILVWTPCLLVAAPGLVRRWAHVPDWARWLLVGGLLYTVVQAQIDTFTGGTGFYAYRHGLEFIASATPAVAYSLRNSGPAAARAIAVLVSIQFSAIALGAVFDGGFVAVERAWRSNGLVEVVAKAPTVALLGLLLAAAALSLIRWSFSRGVTPNADGMAPIAPH